MVGNTRKEQGQQKLVLFLSWQKSERLPFFFCLLRDRFLLCRPGCLEMCYAEGAGLELRSSGPCLPSPGLKVFATTIVPEYNSLSLFCLSNCNCIKNIIAKYVPFSLKFDCRECI